MKRTYAVFGLGRYGFTVAQELVKNGAEVIAVDMEESVVDKFKGKIPICKCADVTNIEVLTQLGIANVDTVVIAMASHLEESIMATMLCKELGVANVIVKGGTEFNKKILLKVGADKVVIPEYESGVRLAKEIFHAGFVDIVDISNKISMIEIGVKNEWVGKNLIELNLRKKYLFNIVAIKVDDEIITAINPSEPLQKNMTLIVIADVSQINKIV